MIAKGHRRNLDTIRRAARNGDLGLMECTDTATGQPVMVLVAKWLDSDGQVNLVPLGKMFDGNPYEEVIPPA